MEASFKTRVEAARVEARVVVARFEARMEARADARISRALRRGMSARLARVQARVELRMKAGGGMVTGVCWGGWRRGLWSNLRLTGRGVGRAVGCSAIRGPV